MTTAPKPAPAAEFGEGIYKVGTDISPGTYKGTVEDGNGYWARLSSSDTADMIANDLKTSGTMYLTVRSSDKHIEISRQGRVVRPAPRPLGSFAMARGRGVATAPHLRLMSAAGVPR